MVVKRVHVGVSGFSYASWRGKFYPSEMKPDEFLSYYSKHLDSVEINSSFYAAPNGATVKSWSERTGGGFAFAFKAPRLITHILKLGRASFDVAGKFSTTLDALGGKRGPILFQLPPFLRKDSNLLEDFLVNTATIKNRVFEFRNASWLEGSTYQLLERHDAGFCVADTEEMEPTFEVTAGLAYFRLRKDSYDAKGIDQWSTRIQDASSGSRECYVFLRHDESGENALLARRLSAKIGPAKN